MYLVAGATGNIGREVVRALLADGQQVRGLIRREGSSLPDGAVPIVGDLNEPESLRPALDGVAGIFLLPGYADMPGLLARAASTGVTKIVQLSGGSAASGDLSNAVTRYMVDTEEAVRASGLSWTILRPSAFASNALQWVDQLRVGDEVRAPFGKIRIAVIHPADIGAVAAIALSTDGHDGRVYQLSGPEATTPGERLAVLADVLNRKLIFHAQAEDEARPEMEAAMPKEYVDAFFDFYVGGSLDESAVLPTVQQLTGHPARTFRDWAIEHAADF